jgi:hypothetical protein
MGGPKVFVSHSSKDNDFTIQFVQDLRVAGAEVWVDMNNLQHGGVLARMNDGLSWCEWLVLVLTPDAIASDFVQMEVYTALHMSMKREIKGVIPFMAVPCDPKAILPLWKSLKYYDATKDYKTALVGLLRALGVE